MLLHVASGSRVRWCLWRFRLRIQAARSAARAERLISAAGLGFAASEAAGRFRHHPQQVIDEDFAVLLRWLRLALTSKSPTER